MRQALYEFLMWEKTDKYMMILCVLILLITILAECLYSSIQKDREERRNKDVGR